MKIIKKIVTIGICATMIFACPRVVMAEDSPQNVYTEVFDNMTDYDYLVLAQMLYHEARGETFEGQLAVVETTLNRVISTKFPDSVHGVILQHGQYSTASMLNGTEPYEKQWEAIEYVKQNGNTMLDTDYLYFSMSKQRYATDYVKIDHQWFGREK
jgi:spore germination cell wall hydrolase CwlJ-like protein